MATSNSTRPFVLVDSSTGKPTTIDQLRDEFPELVAYDESGWELNLDTLRDDPDSLADAGYGPPETRRILFWATEEESENDPGRLAVASGRWEVPR